MFVWTVAPSIIAYEYVREQDKADVLFEKKFFNYITGQLDNYVDVVIEEISDSNLSDLVNSVLEAISVLLDLPELLENKVNFG